MGAFTLILLLGIAVLISAVIDQLVPKISLPLIQIALGVAIALVSNGDINVTLDPELFLVLFIAPLLYDEAKNADKASLWHHINPVLSLAIGLVVATALVIGFSLHYLIPSIPLFAAFALGAALGPTDAVAVSSLSKEVAIPPRQQAILKGELLLNDASGIVSFQFAIAAGVTGTFSLLSATGDFLLEFFGGLIVGALLGLIGNFIVRQVRNIGVENTTFHVLFEVAVPFLIYLISTALHVSGIIAVVVGGLMNVVSPRAMNPSVSRMNIVSSSVWRVLSFALNGCVFIMLGTQLPRAMSHTWDDVSISNTTLIGYILLLTLILMGVRFLWILVMDLIHVKRKEKRSFTLSDVRLALATTLCGAKGTITLSILFTIPMFLSYATLDHPAIRFPQRELIIFLACGVILCTLLLATFVVPLLVPRPKKNKTEIEQHESDIECYLEILANVIEELVSSQTTANRAATRAAIALYNDRITLIKERNDIDDDLNIELRLQALEWEREKALEIIDQTDISPLVGYRYLSRIEQTERLLRRGQRQKTLARVHDLNVRLRTLLRRGVHSLIRELPDSVTPNMVEEQRQLQLQCVNYVISRTEQLIADNNTSTEDATDVLLEYQRIRTSLLEQRPSLTTAFKLADSIDDIRRRALQLELEQIQSMYEEERISREMARHLRENVALMQMDLEDHI